MLNRARFLEIGPDGRYHPVANPPAALPRIAAASHSRPSLDEDDGDVEEVESGRASRIVSPVTVKRPRKGSHIPFLDRAERALCRVLVKKHGVPVSAIQREFGWTVNPIYKAVKNQYRPPDKDADEPYLPANFESILKKFTDDESDDEPVPNRSASSATTKSAKGSTPRKSVRSCARLRTGTSAPSGVRKAAPPRPSIPSGPSPSPSPSHDITLVTTESDHDFLENFTKTHISPDPKWCAALEKAGFTKENMIRMGRFPKAKIVEFIASKFPEMSDVQQFFFAEAVEQVGMMGV